MCPTTTLLRQIGRIARNRSNQRTFAALSTSTDFCIRPLSKVSTCLLSPRRKQQVYRKPNAGSGSKLRTSGLKISFSTLAMASKALVESATQGSENRLCSSTTLQESVTVIRYQPGDERFQMQVTLANGKVFNFNRSCTETVSTVLSRMVANIEKKIKTFNGVVKMLASGGSLESLDIETTEIGTVLTDYVNSSFSLQLQVGDDKYEVVFNPPEVYVSKFFATVRPTFPVFPYRLETSSNFCKEKSIFKWEFSMSKPSPVLPPKLRKKSVNVGDNKGESPSEWTECGNSFIFTPKTEMEGGYLRFSCTPSNGSALGKPFRFTLPNPIERLPVEKFLYEERLSRLSPRPESGDCFRVLTYNALADTYATPEWFISSPKESLDVGYRLPILDKEIALYQADLICLQEVDEKFYEGNFKPFLSSLGYKGIHTSKTGKTNEGIATFHNPAKLTVLNSYVCVILEHMKTLPMWERLLQIGDEFVQQRLEERNTVFQVSVFQVNNAKEKTIIVLGNVHLYFHPDADHIRLLQTITCIDYLQTKLCQLKETYPDHKVAVLYCGDLNCTPPFSSYRLLTTGLVDENDEDWTSHPEDKISPGIQFKHSLNLTNSHPAEELTNITTCFEGCLDYILYQAENFELLNTCPPPSKEELAAFMNVDEVRKLSLPNFYTPSDHVPLIADFKIK